MKSTGIDNLSLNSNLKAIPDATFLLPSLDNNGRMNVNFSGNYFVQNKVLHPNTNNIVNIYIVYKLDLISFSRNTDYTIQNALFGVIKITKNVDSSKNKYEGYGIYFDVGSSFTSGNITNGKNLLIFGADMSLSTHSTNKANNIYVLGKDFVQGINGTILYAENIYKTNFTEPNKKFLLTLHYDFSNSYLFVNGTQELRFKKNDQICVGNLSDNWTTTNSEQTRLYGKVYDSAVDYQAIDGVKTIYDVHKYLMTKHNI